MIASRGFQLAARLLAAAPGLFLLACGDALIDREPRSRCDQAAALRSELFGNSGPQSAADEADLASRFIPGGFGGLYQDLPRQVLVVNLVDLTRRDSASLVLGELLRCNTIYPGWSPDRINPDAIEFRQGAFTGQALRQWEKQLQGAAWDREVWGTEIDPLLNRIWVGARFSDLSETQRLVPAAQVPIGAVIIEGPPPVATVAPPIEVPGSQAIVDELGTIGSVFTVGIRFHNEAGYPVYTDRCAVGAGGPFRHQPWYRLEKWEPARWRSVFYPICPGVLLDPPISVPARSTAVDTVRIDVVYRLQSIPIWDNSRIGGTYRLVVAMYGSAVGNPPQPTDRLADSAGSSEPFRLLPAAR